MMAAEKRAAEVASRHGIIGLRELLDAGFSKDAVRRRVDSGWLTRLHSGVFSLGAPGHPGRIEAALRAGGPQAIAAAGSAAALDDLLPFPAAVSIVVPRGSYRPAGVDVREATTMPAYYLRHGLRTTTPPETLLALAADHYSDARDALDRAFVLRRTNTEQLRAFLAGQAHRRGVAVLRDLVEGPRTRSQLERSFLAMLRDARLPLPEGNVEVNGHLVDFWWAEQRVVGETDGWASHGRRAQWERDHARDLDHFGTGVATVRLTYLQVSRRQLEVCARLGARLL